MMHQLLSYSFQHGDEGRGLLSHSSSAHHKLIKRESKLMNGAGVRGAELFVFWMM